MTERGDTLRRGAVDGRAVPAESGYPAPSSGVSGNTKSPRPISLAGMGGGRATACGQPAGSPPPGAVPCMDNCGQMVLWRGKRRPPRVRCDACRELAREAENARRRAAYREEHREARQKRCSECGREFEARRDAITCSKTCRERRRWRVNAAGMLAKQRRKYARRRARGAGEARARQRPGEHPAPSTYESFGISEGLPRNCPVCGDPLPEPSKTGRPPTYCSPLCRERARNRIRRAAKLLEYAAALEEHVGDPAYGSREYVQGRVDAIRAEAAELTRGLE